MYNAQPNNGFMYNTGGNILMLDLSEGMAMDDVPTNTVTKTLLETQASSDAITITPGKQLFETITFSDATILQLFLTKQFPETIRVNDWLTVKRVAYQPWTGL